MKFHKREILPLAVIILASIIGIYLYPQLPQYIPSHWNSQGQIDAYSGRNFGVFFFPILTFAIYLLMTFLPAIDPLKKNYANFSTAYFWFKTIFVIFFVAVYLFTLVAGLGVKTNIMYFILPSMSALFILMGFFLPKVKRNYFVGIKTPWTLHSDIVWDDTHRMSGKLYIIAGVVSLIGLLFPDYAFAIFMTAIILASLASVVYSYFSFKKNANQS